MGNCNGMESQEDEKKAEGFTPPSATRVESPSTEPVEACSPYDCSAACTSSKIAGTLKPHDKHIMICDSSPWAAHVNESSAMLSTLFDVFESTGKLLKTGVNLNMTACDFQPIENESKVVILLFPESLMITCLPSSEQFAAVATFIFTGEFPSLAGIEQRRVPYEKMIFVCKHESRDRRCGRAGPQIIDTIKRSLVEKSIPPEKVGVFGCSHIGGHKFAGTLIVYPEADWYGYISIANAAELLDNILSNQRLDKCWRGRQQLLSW